MSFRRRLTLYGTGIAALTTLILSVLLIVLTIAGARGDQRDRLVAAAVDTAEVWAAQGGRIDGRPPVDLATTDEIVTAIASGGRLTPGVRIGATDITVPPETLLTAIQEDAVFVTLTVDGTEVVAAIDNLGTSADEAAIALQRRAVADSATDDLGPALVIASVLILIAAWRASSVVARRALAPLERISTVSQWIATTGDTSRRLDVKRSGREIDGVVDSFNTMIDRLGRSSC